MRSMWNNNTVLGLVIGLGVSIIAFVALDWLRVTNVDAGDAISAASAIIALSAFALAMTQTIHTARRYDAEFVFQSEKDYGELYPSLVVVGNFAKLDGINLWLEKVPKHEIMEGWMDEFRDERFGRKMTEILTRLDCAPDIENTWFEARKIKSHFKAVDSLYSSGAISKTAASNAVDQAGFDLLVDCIWKLDIASFYYTWRKDPEKVTRANLQKTHAFYYRLTDLREACQPKEFPTRN